jgi:hyperosmotically inducible protein
MKLLPKAFLLAVSLTPHFAHANQVLRDFPNKDENQNLENTDVTASEQGRLPNDILITQRIRQALVKDKKLSTYGKNVKIITINGRVTLKGPVDSTIEEASILQKARAVAGKSSIVNQLSIPK